MVPVSRVAAITKWLRWKGCTWTRPGHAVLDKTTEVGIGRCMAELVQGR